MTTVSELSSTTSARDSAIPRFAVPVKPRLRSLREQRDLRQRAPGELVANRRRSPGRATRRRSARAGTAPPCARARWPRSARDRPARCRPGSTMSMPALPCCRASAVGRGPGPARRLAGVAPGVSGRCHRSAVRTFVAPSVREPHEAHLARLAGDDERALDVVEQAHALGIERVRAHDVLAGQERDARQRQRERVAVVARCGAARRRPCRSRRRRPACRRRARCRSARPARGRRARTPRPTARSVVALRDAIAPGSSSSDWIA